MAFREELGMNRLWGRVFKKRMDNFEVTGPSHGEGLPVSIKVRDESGWFHREHSPEAYAIIDDYWGSHAAKDMTLTVEERESGPEILVHLAVAAAGLILPRSVIDLVTAIVNARTDGVKKGDKPDAPMEIIVRGFYEGGKFYQETILRIDSGNSANAELVGKALSSSVDRIWDNRPGKR